ncbi:hypothetical protein LX16_3482 [Stackebrandtia albiflava]|uniref:Uncharacterized protein n=1 Tax=Stackebrandtia albiflava TaxID=406432 RepID=A0A562V4H3_9ACTN|nr:hypothetical protein [Stackebrandtia albiflava]TWJ12718.1 hypothetical protein LX16_3482 [Stackebrandtia albiflava]
MGRHSQPDEDDKSNATETDTDALDSDATPTRSAKADAFWEKVGVEPVEIALPKGVGLTLRAYRMSDTVEPVEAEEEPAEEPEPKPKRGKGKTKPEPEPEPEDVDEELDEEFEDDDEESDEDVEEPVEEIPVFLTLRGRLPLFDSPKALVKFVKSRPPTELSGIDTWDELVKGIKPEYVVASEDDTYELDLVVRNLRGGHDTWDPDLIVSAAEVARDLGYALRIPSVMSTLAQGSPLDDLDNALRAVAEGGLRAVFAKRRARKVGAEQTSLAWRGIVVKINDAVDWRK